MENHLESIRAALATDASNEVRRDGIAACHAVLAALAPPDTVVTAQPQASPSGNPAQLVESAIALLRHVPIDRVLDMAIATLKAKVPASNEAATARALTFHLVPVPSTSR